MNLYTFIQIFLQNRIFIDEIGFIVLFKNFDAFGLIQSFKRDCFSFYVRRDIIEVKIASSLLEGDRASILDHGKLVVIYGES